MAGCWVEIMLGGRQSHSAPYVIRTVLLDAMLQVEGLLHIYPLEVIGDPGPCGGKVRYKPEFVVCKKDDPFAVTGLISKSNERMDLGGLRKLGSQSLWCLHCCGFVNSQCNVPGEGP